ncbi:MAG: glycosyltransferase family 39 protein [Solirubrobacteraceae bacterium]
MATIAAPRRTAPLRDLRVPERVRRLPAPVKAGAFLLGLLAISAFIRTRYVGGQFWMDEALTTGIASHSLSAIPGVLRHDGSPPLFYLVLHVWMSVFGSGEAATHALSLTFGLLTIPVGMWAGWSLFGRRAGYMAAVLFAFNAFLTQYAQETRMYELMGLLGLLATAGFLHAFVFRRRKYLILFAVSEALMLYTHSWGIFFGAGAAVALIPVYLTSEDRRGIVRDALLAFVGAGVLYLPWLPNFIYQATHTGDPWANSPRLGAPVLISRDLLGGDRVTVALVIAAVIGFVELAGRRLRRTREATLLYTLLALPAATLLLAWLASQLTPAFVSRYFAPVLASFLLLGAWGCARARIVGVVAVVLTIVFVANAGSFTPEYKSDVRDVAGEMAPLLHAGDLVIVGQPEQVPLTWYYLPAGLRYANITGPVSDPRYMNWVNALHRLQHANPRATLAPLLATLRLGQQVLFVRPMTEGAQNWEAPWTQLVRRRSAQWGALLQSDPSLKSIAWAPHNYRGSCCVADSALLYKKVS